MKFFVIVSRRRIGAKYYSDIEITITRTKNHFIWWYRVSVANNMTSQGLVTCSFGRALKVFFKAYSMINENIFVSANFVLKLCYMP